MSRLTPEERCVEQVRPPGAYYKHQCSRRGVIHWDEKLWCKQHAPLLVKDRRDEADARFRAAQEIDRVALTRRKAEELACKDLNTKALEKGVMQQLFKGITEGEDSYVKAILRDMTYNPNTEGANDNQ